MLNQIVQQFKNLYRIYVIFTFILCYFPHVMNKKCHLLLLQIETLQQENSSLKKQAQKLKEQFQQQKVSHLPCSRNHTKLLYFLCMYQLRM